jgi:hypothetical protein
MYVDMFEISEALFELNRAVLLRGLFVVHWGYPRPRLEPEASFLQSLVSTSIRVALRSDWSS